MAGLGLPSALTGLFSFSVGDVAAKKAAATLGNYIATLIILGVGIIPIVASLVFLPQNLFSSELVLISAAIGFFLGIGYLLIYKSLETEQASNVWAFWSLQSIFAIFVGVFALGESVSKIQAIEIFAVFAGIFLVAVTENYKLNRKLIFAFFGNVSWGVATALLVYSVGKLGLGSTAFLFYGRIFSLLMIAAFYLLMVKKRKVAGVTSKSVIPPIVDGACDGIGQLCYVLIILFQFVVIGAAIIATETLLVPLLSRIVYKERLTLLQIAGIVISTCGAVALAL